MFYPFIFYHILTRPLDTTEILLLLLWRHLRHFLSSNSPSAEDAGSFMRSVSAPLRRPAVLEHLRADAEIAIREITLELDEIEVVSYYPLFHLANYN